MSEEGEEVLKFPCQIAVKAMGYHSDEFESIVVELVCAHLPEDCPWRTSTRPSKNGKYLAVSFHFEAHSREQLDNIYHTLTADSRIVMAL